MIPFGTWAQLLGCMLLHSISQGLVAMERLHKVVEHCEGVQLCRQQLQHLCGGQGKLCNLSEQATVCQPSPLHRSGSLCITLPLAE